MDTSEERVGFGSNRLNRALGAGQHVFQQPAAAAVHGVDHNLKTRPGNSVPVHQGLQMPAVFIPGRNLFDAISRFAD